MTRHTVLLKIDDKRAFRLSATTAAFTLHTLGYEKGSVIRHTIHRDSRETIVTEYHRTSDLPYSRARLTETFAI